VGPCEHGNEPSDSAKQGKFLSQLSYYQLLNKDCDAGSWVDYVLCNHTSKWSVRATFITYFQRWTTESRDQAVDSQVVNAATQLQTKTAYRATEEIRE